MVSISGTQFWKYFPTKAYKTFAESEELIYDVINEIVQKILIDDKEQASDTEVTSILEKVINTDGLDMKDKICGIVGEFKLRSFKRFEVSTSFCFSVYLSILSTMSSYLSCI